MRTLLPLISLLFLLPARADAQLEQKLEDENRARAKTNVVAMSVLGGWSVTNIGLGLGGWASAETPWIRDFHLMNAGWNGVNLAIAGFGLFGALSETPQQYDVWETIKRSENIERALLVNAALDIAYVAGGAYLALRGQRDDDPRLLGFGRSIMLQGAFLLSFDTVFYIVHAARNGRFMKSLRSFELR